MIPLFALFSALFPSLLFAQPEWQLTSHVFPSRMPKPSLLLGLGNSQLLLSQLPLPRPS